MEKHKQEIQNFQRRLFAEYANTLQLPANYKYLYGNPVKTAVPLDTVQGGLFIIGKYPQVRFATIDSVSNVPLEDYCGPFSTEKYFDGRTVQIPPHSWALDEYYLSPLGVIREQCWITHLVKVFLFTRGQIDKHRKLGCSWPPNETWSRYKEFAHKSLPWLEKELILARPKIVIALGFEVAGVLQGVSLSEGEKILDGKLRQFTLGDRSYPVIHLPYPDWRIKQEVIRDARRGLKRLLKT